MRLADMRKRVNLKQVDVGKSVGVAQNAVSQWESGETRPSFDKLLTLAKLYGVSTDEIIQAIQEARTA